MRRDYARTRAVIRPRPPARRSEHGFNGWMEESRSGCQEREVVEEEQDEAPLGFETPTCELATKYQRGGGGGQEKG